MGSTFLCLFESLETLSWWKKNKINKKSPIVFFSFMRQTRSSTNFPQLNTEAKNERPNWKKKHRRNSIVCPSTPSCYMWHIYFSLAHADSLLSYAVLRTQYFINITDMDQWKNMVYDNLWLQDQINVLFLKRTQRKQTLSIL